MGDHSLIYRKKLSSKPHGLAVFTPDPDDAEPRHTGIEIGDVGMWSEDGSFNPLFNYCLPATHLANRNGVPKDFEQVKLGDDDISKRRYHCPGTVITRGNTNKISIKIDGGSTLIKSGNVEGGVGFEGLSSESAFLHLPDGAITEVLRKLIPLRNATKRNCQNIYMLLTERGWMPPDNEPLFVVTGTTKTRSWSLGVCTDASRLGEISVNISAAPVAHASAAIAFGSKDTCSITIRKSQPHNTNLNQTVFLLGYFLPKPSPWRHLKALRNIFSDRDAGGSMQQSILPHSPLTETTSDLHAASPVYSPQPAATANAGPSLGPETSELDLSPRLERVRKHPMATGEDLWKGELSLSSVKRVKVAIKLLRGSPKANRVLDEKLKELYIHAAVWQRLNHPNVAHFYGLAFDCGDMPAIIIEDYPHGNVTQYLTANPQVSQGHKLQLLQDIARGLEYLHEFDPAVVHGNLRGANVLIDQRDRAVLAHYGLVVTNEASKPTFTKTTGTATSSPEVRDCDDDLSSDCPASLFTMPNDIYDFGITAIEIFSSDEPFAHKRNDQCLVFSLASKQPDLPLYLQLDSPTLGELVQRCWNQDPTERPSARSLREIAESGEFIPISAER